MSELLHQLARMMKTCPEHARPLFSMGEYPGGREVWACPTEGCKYELELEPEKGKVKMNEESLGRIVEMWTAQGTYHGVGMAVAYCERPTMIIRTPAGKQVSWSADLCREPGLSVEAGQELIPQDNWEPEWIEGKPPKGDQS